MADSNFNNPMTAEHYERLQRMRQMIAATKPLIERCEKCGLDMSGQASTLNAYDQFGMNVEREFFQNGKPLQ